MRRGVAVSVLFACSGCDLPPTYADRPAWEARAADLERGIRAHLGLVHLDGTIGDVQRHGRIVHDDYTVEGVAFASLPGFYVTGNLYLPRDRRGPLPVVLNPHGHFDEAGWYPRTRPEIQIYSATLARMGAIAFAWDMVGYGDSRQLAHEDPLVAALQTWNALRAIDFLRALDDVEVDGARIAVVGASGGASQGIMLTALSPQIGLAAHVAMVSASYAGSSNCEDLYPQHLDLHGNLDVTAMAAPRPLLVVSDGDDWTSKTPERELPFLEQIYRLYDAADSVANVHLEAEGHDFGPSKRAAAYAFIGERFGLPVVPERGELDPHGALTVWTPVFPQPQDALEGHAAIAQVFESVVGGLPEAVRRLADRPRGSHPITLGGGIQSSR